MVCAAALASVALIAPPASAQRSSRSSASAGGPGLVSRLQSETSGRVRLARSSATGLVRFLTTDRAAPVPRPKGTARSAEAAARGFLGAYGELFGVRDPASMRVLNVRPAPGGRRSVKFGQTENGIPVLAGELVVGLDASGDTLSANGEVVDTSGVVTTPLIGRRAAALAARVLVSKAQHVSASAVRSGATTLAIYDPRLIGGPGPAGARLVWRTEVTARSATFDELAVVDAQTGAVTLHFDTHAEAKNRQVCDRGNWPGAPQKCTAPYVRAEGDAPTGIIDVDRAYDFAGETYDFYLSKFGRDSLDNAGLPIKSTTRFCPDAQDCPFDNAFWDGTQMVYGAGFAVDDVVGHELTHAVTQFESNLFYFGQSGAINESLSDVFGEFVDLTNHAGGGDDSAGVRWELGEDIGTIRDMSDPTRFGDPDRMQSPDYRSGYADNGGVHSNSGVNNKADFLMTDGGTFNGRTVTGLGIDKVARIYYEAEVHLLTSGSDYADLHDILPQACKNLTGTSGITAADCVEVRDAVDATQMDLQPTTAGAAAPEAPLCATGQIPSNLFFDDLENTGSGNWVKSHAAGSFNWEYPVTSAFQYGTSGTQNFHSPDPVAKSDLSIARTASVVVPSAGTTYLRFNHMYDLEANFDGGVVEYSTNGGATYVDAGPLFDANGYDDASLGGTSALAGRATFTNFSAGYISSRINLTSLAGKSVRFRFRVATDAGGASQGWFVDDIRVYRCVAGSGAPTVNAGADQTVDSGAAFALAATATDPEGRPVAYAWAQLSGPSAKIVDPRERVAFVHGVSGGTSGHDLAFRVTATDAQGLTATDTVTVHVRPK